MYLQRDKVFLKSDWWDHRPNPVMKSVLVDKGTEDKIVSLGISTYLIPNFQEKWPNKDQPIIVIVIWPRKN